MWIDNPGILTIIIVKMSLEHPFILVYARLIKEYLKSIEPKYYSLIHSQIEALLLFEPDVETRNRKPLKRPGVFESTWEIRFGPENCFRVFYKVDRKEKQVNILAIGEKRGNRLFIGGKEIEL